MSQDLFSRTASQATTKGMPDLHRLTPQITACQLCAARFADTHSAHAPRPVVWLGAGARILVAGQAPGMRVHKSGKPFDDPSGERLRDWLGIGPEVFYDTDKLSILPMAFCFPGYDAKGSDLPPPNICAQTWRAPVLEALPKMRLTLLIGGYAQVWHLGKAAKPGVTKTVADWRRYAPDVFPLPHPSWRNSGWLKKHPWFGAELLPSLRARVQEVLHD